MTNFLELWNVVLIVMSAMYNVLYGSRKENKQSKYCLFLILIISAIVIILEIIQKNIVVACYNVAIIVISIIRLRLYYR